MNDQEENLSSLLRPILGATVGWYAGRALAGVLSWMAWIGVIGACLIWLFTGSAVGAYILTLVAFGIVMLILFLILRALNKKIMDD